MNILITGVGGPAGRATTSHNVVGVDMQEVALADIDSFELVPAANDPDMINQLAALVDHYDVDLLIPTVADELPMVAKASQLGQLSNAQVVISPLEAVEKCFDKLLTMRALREAGVSVPPFGLPSDFTSSYDVFEQLGGAIITKPRVARGGRGFAIHTSPEKFQLESYDDSYIIQAFAPGEEFAPMVYIGDQPGNETVSIVAKTQEEFCETAAPIVRANALDVALLAVKACHALKLKGPIDLDVRRMADGHPVVLEVNARFGANSSLAPELLAEVLKSAA